MHIFSSSNPKIKRLKQLSTKKSLCKKENIFLVEGEKEITFALASNYRLKELYVGGTLPASLKNFTDLVVKLKADLLNSILYRKDGDSLLAIFERKRHNLKDLKPTKDGIYFILESVEKPGNIGAILRTADAIQAEAVILTNSNCDLYSPNAIRSSVGCLFFQKIALTQNEELYQWLQENQIKIFATDLQNSNNYLDENYTSATAFVLGTENSGISDFWKKKAGKRIKIPMLGKNDSLNVSVAAAIFAFEAKRQRINEEPF
jgi:TrmH family RNA methyltransferase|tara:strand:+ start:4400 stop:5182 length:783 start_codon:yes stop_codon:yes gene_type:complete